MTVTTFPRTQHWTTEGFRFSILIYKSNRRHRCDFCGQPGAIHWVSADGVGTSTGKFSASANVCDACRPARGSFPALPYERILWNGERDDPEGIMTTERLRPNPEWSCNRCGQPAIARYEHRCRSCKSPAHNMTRTNLVVSYGQPDRMETRTIHDPHTLTEWHYCETCRTVA